jgi:BirA family biotin operon repressor/biotin-[acetyl-CoA-carboxylase] ligase
MTIGSTRIHHEKVSSTNTLALALLNDEHPAEGTVITASFQGHGRGQKGNSWESEQGKNLLMSVILYPVMIRPEEQFIISQLVSLAVNDLVRAETADAKIKWPNDIYVRDDKIAGILIENGVMGDRLCSSVAGIGLNVNQKMFSSGAPNPISLALATGREYDLKGLTSVMIRLLDERYKMVTSGMSKRLAEDYHSVLYRQGEWHYYKDAAGEFAGKIEEASNDGLLRIRRKNGAVKEYAFREIDYIL